MKLSTQHKADLKTETCDLPVTVIVTHVDSALTVFHAAKACWAETTRDWRGLPATQRASSTPRGVLYWVTALPVMGPVPVQVAYQYSSNEFAGGRRPLAIFHTLEQKQAVVTELGPVE